MKKNNNKGFVLAETLVVAVFLMIIFSMIYSYFYPLIGEYEKREVYDDVDGKYAVFWLRKMIEDPSYQITSEDYTNFFAKYGFLRFRCSDINNHDKQGQCVTLVKALQVEGCNDKGNNCNIFITKYTLKAKDGSTNIKDFKNTIANDKDLTSTNSKKLVMYRDNYFCGESEDGLRHCQNYFKENVCCSNINNCLMTPKPGENCDDLGKKVIFRSGFVDYIETLPDFNFGDLSSTKYRVIASFQHKLDGNNYYSYATMEVNR